MGFFHRKPHRRHLPRTGSFIPPVKIVRLGAQRALLDLLYCDRQLGQFRIKLL